MDEHGASFTTSSPRFTKSSPTSDPGDTRRERRNARVRQRRGLTLLLAPVVIAVLAVGTMGAAPSGSSEPYSANAEDTIADIQGYWATTMPEVYRTAYEAIPSDRLFPYSSSNPPPGCGTRGNTPYSEVAGNAFYCDTGDFIAWDTEELFPKLTTQFGAFAPALVLAHESGHAIQARVGFQTYQSIYLEQQADCFAGAWAGHVASGDSSLSASPDDLDRALAGMLQLSDPIGIDGSQDGAHGNGFDRVSAFQEGAESGAAACAQYENDPPAVTETGFTSQADYASGGDMALSDLVPALQQSLTDYWSRSANANVTAPRLVSTADATSCDGSDGGVLSDSVQYCSSSNTIQYDPAALREAYSSVGDFSAAMLVTTEWSSAVQHASGTSVNNASARRVSECMSGAYTASIDPTRRTTRADSDDISLSPGDLDEVISTLVGAKSGDVDRDRAFDRVAAFRTGYLEGANACTR